MGLLKIFIVEDDKATARMLEYYLSLNPDNEVEVFHNGKDCLANLNKEPDVICLDYFLPNENGEDILKKIKSVKPEVPVIIVSAQQEVSIAVDLLRKGAYDYLVKSEDVKERLWRLVNQIRENQSLSKQIKKLQEEVEEKYDFNTIIIGESPALKNILPLIEKACRSEITVSISGETGTGKEVVAKTIHYNSSRKNKPFVPVNMAAIPKDLIEAELFGHERGAFTGAIKRRAGKFEEAANGTIFLDEILEMDLAMQVKLLRVLQEQQVVRVGSNTAIDLNVRIIIASNKSLANEVAQGNFREDLYYRLLGLSIQMPPLRERGKDVLLLAQHFINQYCKKQNMKPKSLTKMATEKLTEHNYPGNIRELKSMVELAVILSDDDEIKNEDIQIKHKNFSEELLAQEMTLEDYKKTIIKHFLKRYNNNARRVAEKLNIGKSTVYRIMSSED